MFSTLTHIGRAALLGGVILLLSSINAMAANNEAYLSADQWELGIEWKKPRIQAVRLAGEETKRLYAYLIYTVTNRTEKTQIFLPTIDIRTDRGQLIRANQEVPYQVYREIKKANPKALIELPGQIVGNILAGEDQARTGIAVWAVPNNDVNAFSVFIRGLSSEVDEMVEITKSGDSGIDLGRFVPKSEVDKANLKIQRANTLAKTSNPDVDPLSLKKLAEVKRLNVSVYKTLEIKYQTPGDLAYQQIKPIVLDAYRWIMR